MKRIYLSFLTTRLDLMRKHWEENATLKQKGISGTNKEIGRDVDLGGVLVEIDWDTKKILRKHALSCPSGVSRWGDVIAVASMRQNEIYLLDKAGQVVRTISHPAFNDIHSLWVTSNDTLLVTSTGVDGILEFTREGDCVWQWFAFEHGYEFNQYGKKRILDMRGSVDHREVDYPTLYQATHVNSVMQHKNERGIVLATLFHQGTGISIDKKTGATTTLVTGLHNPHSIRSSGDGYMVSDTKKGSIILLSNDFKEYDVFLTGSHWLQDACMLSNGNFLASRSDENDIVEMDCKTKKIISTFSYPGNWRIYQMEEIY